MRGVSGRLRDTIHDVPLSGYRQRANFAIVTPRTGAEPRLLFEDKGALDARADASAGVTRRSDIPLRKARRGNGLGVSPAAG